MNTKRMKLRCLIPVVIVACLALLYVNDAVTAQDNDQSYVPEKTELQSPGPDVKEPIKGLHEWVACYDFASLYPNTMVQWGISPEVYKGKDLVSPQEDWVKCSSGAYFGGDSEKPILRTIIKDLYSQRKKAKKEMLEIKSQISELEKKLENF